MSHADFLPDEKVILDDGNVLNDVAERYFEEDGKLIKATTQDIDTSYLEAIRWARTEAANRRCHELERTFTVPAVFVTKWLAQGFNIYREPHKEIIKRLHQEGLTDFICTPKRMY